jgi:enediyne biosynthesis protein E4
VRPARTRCTAGLVLAALLGAGCDGHTTPGAGAPPRAEPAGAVPAPGDSPPAVSGADDAHPASAGGGWFTDVAAASGVVFVHDAGRTEEKHLPETMGSGGALCDLDGDGDLDLYLVQGGPLPGREAGHPRPDNKLFLNDGHGRFTDATEQGGDARGSGYGMGVAPGDVDGDGDLDLYLTNFGPDVLLLNDGHARFTDATAASGLSDPRWTTAATFLDADADGDADLFVTGYVQVDLAHPIWCGDRKPGWRSYCHPDAYAGLPPRFWRNDGLGRFTDATAEAGLASDPAHPGKGLGTIAFDVEPDGDLDLYVANDSVENKLWIHSGARFTDGTLLSGTGVDGQGRTEAGMGLATGDVDGDLDLDLIVTNFDDESNTLYRNDGGGLFSDVTAAAGLEGPSRLPVGFGVVLDDLDNDGDLDLVVTNGHIIDNIEKYHDGKSWKQRSQAFVNDGAGRFTEVTAQAGDLSRELLVGRGLYRGDIDDDGDLDLLLTQCNGRALLLANAGGPGGAPAGRAVLLSGLPHGTLVRARLASGRELVREAGTQTSYLGLGSPEVHVGLGDDRLAGLSLAPPGRPATVLTLDPPLASGRLHFVQRPDGLHRAERPAPSDPTAADPHRPPAPPAPGDPPHGPDKP